MDEEKAALVRKFNSQLSEVRTGYIACVRCGQIEHLQGNEGTTLKQRAETFICWRCWKQGYRPGQELEY